MTLDLNTAAKDITTTAVGAIPEIGSALSLMLTLIWPDSGTDYWAEVKDKVEKYVKEQLYDAELKELRQLLGDDYSGIKFYLNKTKLKEPYSKETYGGKTRTINLDQAINDIIPVLKKYEDFDDAVRKVPYFIVVATLLLAAYAEMLRDFKYFPSETVQNTPGHQGEKDYENDYHLFSRKFHELAYEGVAAAIDARIKAIVRRKESVNDYDGGYVDYYWFNDTWPGVDGKKRGEFDSLDHSRDPKFNRDEAYNSYVSKIQEETINFWTTNALDIADAWVGINLFDLCCQGPISTDDKYVYFRSFNKLFRREIPKKGSSDVTKAAELLHDSCGNAINAAAPTYVYFSTRNQELWRYNKDTGLVEKFDDNCGDTIFLDGDYVLFAGPPMESTTGERCDIYCRKDASKDGYQPITQYGDCNSSCITVDDKRVYFARGSYVYSIDKPGIAETLWSIYTVRGDADVTSVYFYGDEENKKEEWLFFRDSSNRLYRSGPHIPKRDDIISIEGDCQLPVAYEDHWIFFQSDHALYAKDGLNNENNLGVRLWPPEVPKDSQSSFVVDDPFLIQDAIALGDSDIFLKSRKKLYRINLSVYKKFVDPENNDLKNFLDYWVPD